MSGMIDVYMISMCRIYVIVTLTFNESVYLCKLTFEAQFQAICLNKYVMVINMFKENY